MINILMAIYKANDVYFKECLTSIQNQTYDDFELVLVNDGGNEEKLKAYLKDFSFAWEIITNEENLGLTRSLNKGLKYCTAKYIARFDDDDVMEPERLKTQIEYLEAHEDCAAVLSNIEQIYSDGKCISVQTQDDNDKIIPFLRMRGNCLCHSTLFIRKEVMDGLNGYDSTMLYAQDYDLYLRLIEKYKLYKIPKPLVKFRVASNRTSMNKSIMSMLCAYYASLKSISKNKSITVFCSRTLRIIVGLYKIVLKGRTYG